MRTSRITPLKTVCFALLSAAIAASTAISQDETAKPDVRVRKLLHQLKIKYVITDKGNYRLDFKIEGSTRSHWVFVSSRTETYGDLETRRIWATAHKMKDMPSKELANELLMENLKQKLGGWEVTQRGDGYRIVYGAKLPTEVGASGLQSALRMVLFSADKMEEKLSKGKDEF